MKNGRGNFMSEQKTAILRRHLVENVPVAEVCDQGGINPTLFYRWRKELFGHGAAALARRSDNGQNRRLENMVPALDNNLADKDQVIGETMESHVRP